MERREESQDIILTAVEDLVLFTTEWNIEWSIPPGAYEKLSRGDGCMPKNRCLWEVMDELSSKVCPLIRTKFLPYIDGQDKHSILRQRHVREDK